VLALVVVLVFWRRRGKPLPARPRRERSKAAVR